MARVFFQTLGCRLNQAESERMAQAFRLEGHEVVDNEEHADLRVVNTCSVTHAAAAKSRRAAIPPNRHQKVVVTGCHSQVHPEEFSGADLIVRNTDKERLAALAVERFGWEGYALGMDYRPSGSIPIYPLLLNHTRAFIKIQDGCNLRCTFCMTTIARGASHSRSTDAILEEVSLLQEKGCKEVVLTGVHAGSYFDPPHTDLGVLIRKILERTKISRLRLSSLEPWNFKTHWISLWHDFPNRLCRHLHMSLQSGSDSVLQRMGRAYTPPSYAEKVRSLRSAIPGLALTSDIMVGFPGETPDEHATSIAFVQRLNLASAHIFTFSPRPGTEAASLPGQVDSATKHQRYREMKSVTDKSQKMFQEAHLGKEVGVLWEQKEKDGTISGLSDTYLRIYTRNPATGLNTIGSTRVTAITDNRLYDAPFPSRFPSPA